MFKLNKNKQITMTSLDRNESTDHAEHPKTFAGEAREGSVCASDARHIPCQFSLTSGSSLAPTLSHAPKPHPALLFSSLTVSSCPTSLPGMFLTPVM